MSRQRSEAVHVVLMLLVTSLVRLTLVTFLVFDHLTGDFCFYCFVCVSVRLNMLLCFIAVKSLSQSPPPLPQSPNTPQLTDGSHFMCV